MHLPDKLAKGIDSIITAHKEAELVAGSAAMSERYREKGEGRDRFLKGDVERSAYLVARLPATYGVLFKILSQDIFSPDIETVLDLGAGFGSALWAMGERFPTIKRMTAVEADVGNMAIGKKLCLESDIESVRDSNWVRASLPHCEVPVHDLVLLSYIIGELSEEARVKTIELAWELAENWVVIIEPGTPEGFLRIRKARDALILKGGTVMAPCPHSDACPIAGGDWCHFGTRIERVGLHRQIKGGTLSYEDEKFSYVVVSKQPAINKGLSRIVRHPQKHKGHLELQLCSLEGGIKKVTVSKKMGQVYKEAKKLDWGDRF